MASTFLGLNTAKSGLNYYQASINTTAHNIANAETDGYSRQQVIAQASSALRLYTSAGMQGTGVTISGIEQVRNPYYDLKYWNTSSTQGEYSVKYDYSYEMETYFDEMTSETGITSLISELQDAIQDLCDDPSDETTRIQYINELQTYTELFNELASDLQTTQSNLNDEVQIYVDEINSIAKQIYTLNSQITSIELRGGNANDLRDQRVVLLDELSSIVNITTTETAILASDGHDSGATRFAVYINGELLLDDLQYRELMVVPRDEKVNETDLDGLYDLAWKNSDGTAGDEFNIYSPSLTGKLAGLIAVRDGNNDYGFVGSSVSAGTDAQGTYVTMTTDKSFTIDTLNIADEGKITIGGVDYYYDNFDAEYDSATGEITSYTFHGLKVLSDDGNSQVDAQAGQIALGATAKVGTNVDFEGVPYYMSKLNEFVRVFSRYINDLTTSGADQNGDAGLDMLTTVDTNGDPLDLVSTVTDTSFNSKKTSYYRLTALNWEVNDEIVKDPTKVVVSDADAIAQNNVEDNSIAEMIRDSFSNTEIFKQGTPSQFLESVVATLAIQTKQCKTSSEHQENIAYSIEQQRLSVSSVDQNEEGANLIIQQNGYNLSCKVMSVLDEIYDRLINYTGV